MIELRIVRRWSPQHATDTRGWLWRVHRRMEDGSKPGPRNLRTTVYVHAARAALSISLALAVSYGALSLAGWWWYRRQLGERVALVDVAWPARWPRIGQARADVLCEHGFRALEERRYGDAARLLTLALRRAPTRDDARVALARLFATYQDFPRAYAVIDEALSVRPVSTELLQTAFALTFQCEDYTRALRYADLTLAHPHAADTTQHLFAQQSRVRALAALGRGSDALRAAEALAREADANSWRCRIEALLAHEDFPAAVKLGRAAQSLHPVDPALLETICRAARSARDPDALAAALTSAIAAQPDQPAPRITAVLEWWQAGDQRRTFAALDGYLLRFDSEPDALYRLSTAATALGAVPLLDAIYVRAISLGHPSARFAGNLIEAYLINGDVDGLRRMRPSLPALAASGDPVLQLWPKVVEAVFQVVEGDPLASGLSLLTLTRQLHLPPAAYGHFVDFLLAADRPGAACELLDQASAIFPTSPTLNSLIPPARAALAAAREHRPAFALHAPVIFSEAEFFPAAETLLSARQHTELTALMTSHRRANPPWLAQRRRDFDWLDLRRALAGDDLLTTRAIAQLYLNGDPDRLDQALALAAHFPAAPARETLLALIQRAYPDATSQLASLGLLPAAASSGTNEQMGSPRR